MTQFDLGHIVLSARQQMPVGPVRGIVLALHGGGYTAGYWDYAPTSLLGIAARRGYLAVAIDRPGYGAASRQPMSLDQQAEVVLDLAEHLRAEHGPVPVLLAGHSMGGILTLMTGAKPRATSLLTALDASGVPLLFPPAMQDALLARALGPDESHFPAIDPTHARAMFFGPDGTFDAAALAQAEDCGAPVPGAELADAAHAPAHLPAVMRAITLPLRLTFAEFEQSSIADAQVADAAQRDLGSCRRALVRFEPSCGHNISLHHAGTAYHEGMIDWLEENLTP